ncbi:hypothetical protein AMTR_s00067p00203930 [Amborella trichopoda]|uniref:Uncharacterized protein n=1 Tax=Amborella trichopoda TaxID=13333 RepID=U5DBZ0_AMBTC|nr:hypothetical protein AMTR_s00067p00203930 [Amborella trichopoda]
MSTTLCRFLWNTENRSCRSPRVGSYGISKMCRFLWNIGNRSSVSREELSVLSDMLHNRRYPISAIVNRASVLNDMLHSCRYPISATANRVSVLNDMLHSRRYPISATVNRAPVLNNMLHTVARYPIYTTMNWAICYTRGT